MQPGGFWKRNERIAPQEDEGTIAVQCMGYTKLRKLLLKMNLLQKHNCTDNKNKTLFSAIQVQHNLFNYFL